MPSGIWRCSPALLVLVGSPPVTRLGAVFDAAVLLLSGLSGPFCLLLLPVAAWSAIEQRSPSTNWRLGILGATALVQIAFLVGGPHRGHMLPPLGAGPLTLARIVSLQIFLGAELGFHTISAVPTYPAWRGAGLPIAVPLVGVSLTAIALLRGPRLVAKVALFAGLALAAGLASPLASATVPQWQAMTIPPVGNRYCTFPVLAWIAVLFALAADRSRVLRAIGAALPAVVVTWAIPRDWHESQCPAPISRPAPKHLPQRHPARE